MPSTDCRLGTSLSLLPCYSATYRRCQNNRAQHPEPLNDQIIFKAGISRQLTTTNLSTVGMNDCCLDNSSPSGHVTAQTVVLAKQAAAWLQHRSTGLVAGTPRTLVSAVSSRATFFTLCHILRLLFLYTQKRHSANSCHHLACHSGQDVSLLSRSVK